LRQLHSSRGRLYLCLSQEAAGALAYSDIGQHYSSGMVSFCLERFREGVPNRLLVDGTFVGPVTQYAVARSDRQGEVLSTAQPSGACGPLSGHRVPHTLDWGTRTGATTAALP
jgi:hypothetical protein